MQTTFRLKAHEISMTLLKSVKTMFAGQEVEIIVKSVEPEENVMKSKADLIQMIKSNSTNAPIINPLINIRDLINESQCPSD